MNAFISMGIALIVGIAFGKLMGKFKIPSVAGYILAGLLIGVSGLHIIDNNLELQLSFLSDLALGIIAFNIGSELEISVIKRLGKSIFLIALCEALGAFILVTGISLLLTNDVSLSLILGAVASATAPAATVMVLKEYKSSGPLTSTLLGVVAVDDAICLMIYSVASAVAKVFVKNESLTFFKVVISPLFEILLSVAVGAALGIFLTYLLNKSRNKDELLIFSSGTILLLIGICSIFHLSSLLCAMTLGFMVTNVSNKSRKTFSALEKFSPPLIAGFFVLAGARLDLSMIPQIGVLGLAYLIFRLAGKLLGANLGGRLAKVPDKVRKNIGFGLFSQIGVAVGLAIIVSNEFSGTTLGSTVMTILLATTVVTEILGPICTKRAITNAGEIPDIAVPQKNIAC
ncbi:cation:proton antiporter [Oceanirhabdus seepicola]|uniref:Cation:proton antiporter n=1 Tax=Oceanirhabdus seepicola TaxID=2828781 RepID=A0A9J6P7M8_9CLOT|nr:cation:proton antiporter [Oceanirhabdus seepicola]MCM1991985.1 cation:proton antiporter [Oceanirhabdus seepicola]